MTLLAIDTATAVLSAALGTETETWYFEADAGLRHSELVMDGIATLMEKAGLRPADLSAVVCMGGPGSFTGLRIGFALAKGLALSLGIPFTPFPTLDCMALPFSMWPGRVVPAIDAKKTAFFCALYRDGRRIGPARDLRAEEIAEAIAGEAVDEPALLAGPGAEALCERLAHAGGTAALREAGYRGGYARPLLELARREIAQNPKMFDTDSMCCFAGPEYIRKSDAELHG
jgi:tRNA threonylcarbamoyladenosine biosynthesis protein TsaB